jgi:hypothetical protein
MNKTIVGCLFMLISAGVLFAQGSGAAEAKLNQELQGKTVTVKLDMPATNKGIDVAAGRARSIDTDKYQKRLKTYGTAIPDGRSAVVTRISITGNKITLELDGGGAADVDITALIGPRPEGTTVNSSTEARARMLVNAPNEGSDKDNNNSTLRYESAKRKREDLARVSAYYAKRDLAIEKIRQTALKQGSRFVIRVEKADASLVTADELKRLLADYVVF